MIRSVTIAAISLALAISVGCNTTTTAARKESSAAAAKDSSCPCGAEKGHPGSNQAGEAPVAFDDAPPVGTKARCPVSGEVFAVSEQTPKSVADGKTYVFCCAHCKPMFDAEPEKYTRR